MKSEKLRLDSLTVGYNGIPLISDITLSLAKGEILTLIGPNGSGKTTVLKSITRHLATIAGTVYLDGKNMRLINGKEVAKKLAVVLTERIRPEIMSCFEFVSAGRYPYTGSFGMLTSHDKEVVNNALEKVNALDISDKDISQISDGQRQRILLARAICQEPEVIVLDEPTSFLDIRHKIELLGILSDMAKKSGISVVMSLHEIDLAQRISDKIVCVKGERIAAYGTPEEIFSDEVIKNLYDIESGSFNALLGNIELAAPQGKARCFVVGGCGCGIPFYRALQKRGIPFAAGILMGNDIDLAVASPLAEYVVKTPPFSTISQSDIEKAKKVIDSVNAVIDCGSPDGELNRFNSELLSYAAGRGKTIIKTLAELKETEL
ncbi:MAG: ABC transporter ATP-binding protein [Spirochaetia bacterium]|nr:ABC transporter ATP-binding protein [Spirochaetia bacterium]